MWSEPCGGAGVILLICESCQRPLEDESLSGRVMYSDNGHTEGGILVHAGEWVGVRQGAFVS